MRKLLQDKDIYMFRMNNRGKDGYMLIKSSQIIWLDDNSFKVSGDTFTFSSKGNESGYILSSKLFPRTYIKIDTFDFIR